MSNYKRMNMIAIPVAIVLLFLMFYVGAAYRLFNDSLWRGVGCIGVSAFAGYMAWLSHWSFGKLDSPCK